MGTKITASMERVFRLRRLPEDDTIFLPNIEISSEIAYRLSVGSTGAVFISKITASMERVFRLRRLPEDDTIFLPNIEISSEIAYRLSVGSTGAVFILFI